MRKKFWKTEEFKKIQKDWEDKLRESGFNDLEQNGKLVQNSQNVWRTQVSSIIEGKRRYFELLEYWCHAETFKDDVERFIIEKRSEGLKINEISAKLKTLGKRSGLETIRKTLRYYENKWQIKKKP